MPLAPTNRHRASRRPRRGLGGGRAGRTGTLVTLALVAALLVPGPAHAESRCVEDAVGDVVSQADGAIVDEPRSDILAACVDYTAERLVITVRVAQPTDPFEDQEWENTATAVGASIDIDGIGEEEGQDGAMGGEEFVVNLGRFADAPEQPSGPPEVRAYIAGTGTIATTGTGDCIFPATFDGVRYVMSIPTGCLANHPDDPGVPTSIRVAPYFVYNSPLGEAGSGAFDEIPDFPGYLDPVTQAPDPATTVTRLSGPSRVETAIAISRDDFPAESSATGLVLARADVAADALAGAALAVGVGGPLLLTNRSSLPSSVEAEIQRVLPSGGTVTLTGGNAAIDEAVADRLRNLGYTVERASGPTRYATSVAVAQATTADPTLIVVADGNGFADALVGGAYAATNGGVQVLSNGAALDDTVAAYLQDHPGVDVVAVGRLAAQAVPDATALAGDDPFSTSVAVAERYGRTAGVAIASGTNFPDGLAGGAHAGRAGVPLLLSWPDVLPADVDAYLQGAAPVQDVVVYGGTAALSYQVEVDAAAAQV